MHEIRSRIDRLRKKVLEINSELSEIRPWLRDPDKNLILKALKTTPSDSANKTFAPKRVVYVDINGNDNTGDGSFLNPFLTVEKGVDVANAIDVGNVFVALGPGRYPIDNPLNLPNNTFLYGWDNNSWVVEPMDTAADIFQINDVNAEVVFVNGAFIGLATTGAGVNQIAAGTTTLFFNITFRDFANAALEISNGTMFCEATELSELDSIGTGYRVSNGATFTITENRVLDDATVTTVFDVDGSGTRCNIIGPTFVDSTNVTTFLDADNGCQVELLIGVADGPTTGILIDGASEIDSVGFVLRNTTTDINVVDTASILRFVGAALDKNKIIFPTGFNGENMLFQDNTEDEEATKIYGDLFVGRPESGTVLCTGEGEPSTRGMIVLTTDSTATSTTDGGNFIDVTTAATSPSGSTFSFQGTAANHTILLASTLNDGTDLIQHPGVFILQTTAAVEVTPRSFLFEYWDGAAWETITVLSIEEINSFRYGNEVFIRANTREHIRYNPDIEALWMKKTINGTNAFWSRIRIDTAVTTAPVFEQFRIHANFGEFAEDGYTRFYGRARFRTTLLAFGNVWGESGGVLDASIPIGSGGIPTGWNHEIKNGQLNGSGDAIYLNLVIPRGIDTGASIRVRLIYHPETAGASTDATVIFSVLPIEIQGTLEADPTGGTTPVARTLTNTELVTANTAQTTNASAPMVVPDKLQSIESDPVDISNYYEGDMIAIRIEYDATGSANKDFIVWGVELNAVQWALGERLS